MFRVALKSLLGRKVRLLMSTFAIVLGVAFVCGTLIFSDTLSKSFATIFASSVGDVVVTPKQAPADGADSVSIPGSVVSDIEAEVPGAARVDGNVSAVGVYVVGEDGKLIGGQGAPGIAVNWNDAPAAGGAVSFELVDGEPPNGPDEVVLDKHTADAAGYSVGDQVPVVTASERGPITVTLVGIIDFADGGSLLGASITVFDTATAQELFLDGKDAYTDIWVTAADGVSQTALREQVKAVIGPDLKARTGDETAKANGDQLKEGIGFITTFLLIFAGVALVVGAFLIVNTFSILVAQRARELALLRALGASRKQITRSVLAEAFLLGVIGSTIGLGMGFVLAIAIKALFASFGLDLSGAGLVFAPRTAAVAYLVGIVVTMVAALFPARRSAKIAPVEALRDNIALPETSLRRRFVGGAVLLVLGLGLMFAGLFGWLPRPGWCVGIGVLFQLLAVTAMAPVICRPLLAGASRSFHRLFGTVGRLAGENTLRNPRRTTATAAALMIGLALAGTMSILGASAKASTDQLIADNFVGDYIVSTPTGEPFSSRVARDFADTPGVRSVAALRFGSAEYGKGYLTVGTAPVDQLEPDLNVEMTSGDVADLKPGKAIVKDGWLTDENLEVGDVLQLHTTVGDAEVQIVGVFADDNPVVWPAVLIHPSTYDRMGFPDGDNVVVLRTDDPSADTFAAMKGVVEDNPLVTVNDQASFAESSRKQVDQLVYIIYGLLGLSLLIAVLGIINTLALSVIERTREVGLLRAIGLGRRQLRRMIALESTVISVLGAVLGIVMGLVFGVAMVYSLKSQGLTVLSVPGLTLISFVILSIVIGLLAAAFPARRASRLNVLAAIATE